MKYSNTTEFFKGVSVQTFVTIFLGVLQIVTFAIMSRLLTRDEFGYMATITAIVAVFYSIAEAGLGSSVIQKKEDSQRHFATAFSMSILLGLFFSFVLFAFSPLLAELIADSTIVTPLRIMSILILFNGLISVGQGWLTRQLKFYSLGKIRVVSNVIASLSAIVLAYYGYGIYSIVIQQLLVSVVQLVMIFGYGVHIPHFRIYRNEVRQVLNFGGWLTVGVLFNNLTNEVDKLMMPKLLNVTALGAYNRPAGFISSISTQINSIFDSVLFPLLSKIQDQKERISNVYIKCISLLNIFSIVFAAFVYCNSRLIIDVFFGKEWEDLVPIMQIISISLIFRVDGRLVDCFFRSLGFVKLSFYIRVIGFVLSASCLYIGSKFGLIGASLGLVVSSVFIVILKILVLNTKMECSIPLLLKTWSRSWLVVVPILFLILLFKIVDLGNVLFLVLFIFVLFIELLYFPNYVGKEYATVIYPRIKALFKRVI